ncbi:MAG: type II CRISPR RNA-guided endonuclease Cas9, partial [Rhodospirillaceae bacterium]
YIIRQALANLRFEPPAGVAKEGAEGLDPEQWAIAEDMLGNQERVATAALRKAMGIKRGQFFTLEAKGKSGKRQAKFLEGDVTSALLGPLIPGWAAMSLEDQDSLFLALWAHRRSGRGLADYIRDPTGPLAITCAQRVAALCDGIRFALPTGRLNIGLTAARRIGAACQPGVKAHEAEEEVTGKKHQQETPTERLDRLPYYGVLLTGSCVGGLGGTDAERKAAETDFGLAERIYGRLPNVSVHIALNEVAKLVNALLHRHGPKLRRVVIETTRQLKAGAEKRKELIAEQAERERWNIATDMELRQQGSGMWMQDARERRLRYRLFLRQKKVCPYSGERIQLSDLLTAAYEVDHVIPLGKGGRDTLSNKVICVAGSNKAKGDQTPWQAFHRKTVKDGMDWLVWRDKFLADLDDDTREALGWRFEENVHMRLAAKKAGLQSDDQGDTGFLERQVNDTGHIARLAMHYIWHVAWEVEGKPVAANTGALTGYLRRAWEIAPPLEE